MCGLKIAGNKKELAARLQLVLRSKIPHADDTISKVNKKLPSYKNKRRAKTRKIETHGKVNVPCLEHSLNILELPTEILEYIFDYLDLCDLHDVAKTCKRMQQIAGNCFKQNFIGIEPSFRIAQFRIYDKFYINYYYFIQFFDKIRILEPIKERPNVFYKFLELKSEFRALQNLRASGVNFNDITIGDMEEVLRKLKYLGLCRCEMKDNFLENILAIAPNIKRLCLIYIHTGNQWLTHTYPTLEHCEILYPETYMPVATFLRLNPNIRKFGTDFMNLWENRHLLQTADIKVDDLAIFVKNKLQFASLCQLLNDLHQIGFYKRLKLCIYIDFTPALSVFDQEMVDEMANLTAMVKLYINRYVYFDRVALSDLVHLEDISFTDSRYIIDIETVATKLQSLERIHFGKSKLEHVKMFMSTGLRLEIIEINWFVDDAGNSEEETVLNLFQLNEIRRKLPNAKKITLYVDEDTYLATKRVNRVTDLDFVKLKRTDTFNERNFDFNESEFYGKESRYIHDQTWLIV